MTIRMKIDELAAKCEELGLEPRPSGKRTLKKDYITVLQENSLKDAYGNAPPSAYRWILSLESPMLALPIHNLKEEQQAEVLESDEWFLEEKADGVRLLLYFDSDGKLWAFSRNLSVTNFLPINYGDKIVCDVNKVAESMRSYLPFAIDCEALPTVSNVQAKLESKYEMDVDTALQAVAAILALDKDKSEEIQRDYCPLKFAPFTALMACGKDLLEVAESSRAQVMKTLVAGLREHTSLNFETLPQCHDPSEKAGFVNSIIERGGEGVIAKRYAGEYDSTGRRAKNGWIKIKRELGASLNTDLDAFVTGFKPGNKGTRNEGLVGALCVSAFIRDEDGREVEQEIATVAGIPDDVREKITEKSPDGPALKEHIYNKVITIEGQDMSARNMRVSHARLIQWRPDRSPDSCVLDRRSLEEQIL